MAVSAFAVLAAATLALHPSPSARLVAQDAVVYVSVVGVVFRVVASVCLAVALVALRSAQRGGLGTVLVIPVLPVLALLSLLSPDSLDYGPWTKLDLPLRSGRPLMIRESTGRMRSTGLDLWFTAPGAESVAFLTCQTKVQNPPYFGFHQAVAAEIRRKDTGLVATLEQQDPRGYSSCVNAVRDTLQSLGAGEVVVGDQRQYTLASTHPDAGPAEVLHMLGHGRFVWVI